MLCNAVQCLVAVASVVCADRPVGDCSCAIVEYSQCVRPLAVGCRSGSSAASTAHLSLTTPSSSYRCRAAQPCTRCIGSAQLMSACVGPTASRSFTTHFVMSISIALIVLAIHFIRRIRISAPISGATLRWLQIIERLLQQEPRLRPSAQEVLHKYLQPQVRTAAQRSASQRPRRTHAHRRRHESPPQPLARHAAHLGTAAAPQPHKHEDPAAYLPPARSPLDSFSAPHARRALCAAAAPQSERKAQQSNNPLL